MLAASLFTFVGLILAVLVMSRRGPDHTLSHEAYTPDVLILVESGICPRCNAEHAHPEKAQKSEGFWSTFNCSTCGFTLKSHVCKHEDAA